MEKLPETMRVAMYYANDDVRGEQMPVPQVGRGEVLVRVIASGICGSDAMQWYRIGRTPLVLGHEISGEVAAVGEGAPYEVGQRISASHHVPCGECHYCLRDRHTVCETLWNTNFHPGGFSEYLLLPEINVQRGVYPLPGGVTHEEATFIEPLACVIRGQRAAGIRRGDAVLVLGCGIAGLLHMRLALVRGAGPVVCTDINPWRREAAVRLGAAAALAAATDVPDAFKELNGGRGADVVVLTTGAHPAIGQALNSLDKGGSVLFFAPSDPSNDKTYPLDVNKVFWKSEATLTGTYAANYNEHMEALSLIGSGVVNVKDLITHRLPLEGTAEGFRLVAAAGESIKIIIEPQK